MIRFRLARSPWHRPPCSSDPIGSSTRRVFQFCAGLQNRPLFVRKELYRIGFAIALATSAAGASESRSVPRRKAARWIGSVQTDLVNLLRTRISLELGAPPRDFCPLRR